MHADAGVFFALWLQKPLRIAAAKPSGAWLADAVARCINLTRPGPVAGRRDGQSDPRPCPGRMPA
jgi:hypothetical protein